MGRRQLWLVLVLGGLALVLQSLGTPAQARSVSSRTPTPTTDTPATATTTASSSSSSTATRTTSPPAASSTSATRVTTAVPATTTATPTATTVAAAPSSSSSDSASAEAETSAGTVKPAGLSASSSGSASATTSAERSTTTDTTYVCTAPELARLETFNDANPYLQQTCSAASGSSSYAFPFNGQLSYTQLVAMSSVSACEFYFRGVLLVQLTECEVAGVYVRTTAEAVLELLASAGDLPSEADFTTAVEARGAYNVALRDGSSPSVGSNGAEASSLSWDIRGDTIDTTNSASVNGQLLMTSSLQIVGTYYESPETTSASASDTMSASSDSSVSWRLGSSSTTTLVTAALAILLVGEIR